MDIFNYLDYVALAFAGYIILKYILSIFHISLPFPHRYSAKLDSPIISSKQLLGSVRLQSMHKGVIEGFTYNLLTNSQSHSMVLVTLKRNTKIHLMAIGEKSGLSSLIAGGVSDKFLAPVVLEGDFPSYFKVYVTPGKEVEVRQVMEPRNMAQFVDFCQAYNLEIFKESLYISHAGGKDEQDTTTLIADVETFLKNNNPMLSRL